MVQLASRRPIARRRLAGSRVLLLILLLLVAPALRAGVVEDKAFRKASKLELSLLRAAGKQALKENKAAFAAASLSYAAGESTLADAIDAAVTAISTRRNLLEDAAIDAAENLASVGETLLMGAGEGGGPAEVARDEFLAGWGGIWDAHLAAVDARQTRHDARFARELARFLKRLGKTAKKLAEPYAYRSRLPPHGEAFWAVPSPGAEGTFGEGLQALPPTRVLSAVRFLSATATDTLEVGTRFIGPSMLVVLDADNGGGLFGDAFDGVNGLRRTRITGVGTSLPAGNRLARLSFEVFGSGIQDTLVMTRPRIDAFDGADKPALKSFKKKANLGVSFFSKNTAQGVKILAKALKTRLLLLKKGDLTPDAALREGFGALANARNLIAFWRQSITTTLHIETREALVDALGPDPDVPSDLDRDAPGLYGRFGKRLLDREVRRHAAATKRYTRFVAQVLKWAQKQGADVQLSQALGRQRRVDLPMFMPDNALDADYEKLQRGHFTDIAMMRVGGAGEGDDEPEVELSYAALGDGALASELSSVALSDVEGEESLGAMSFSVDAVEIETTTLPLSFPFLGRLFLAGNDEGIRDSHVFLVTPTPAPPP